MANSDTVWRDDFALDLADGDIEEDLATPQQQDDVWMRRVGRPGGYVAAAAVAAMCVLKLAVPPPTTSSDRSNLDTGKQTAGEVIYESVQPQRGLGGSLISDDTNMTCPASTACRTSSTMLGSLAHALQAAFPGAVVTKVQSVTTSTVHPTLVGRYLRARTPRFDVTVQVMGMPLARSRTLIGTGGSTLAIVEGRSGHLGIRVTVAGNGAAVTPTSGAVRLAKDRRLLSLD